MGAEADERERKKNFAFKKLAFALAPLSLSNAMITLGNREYSLSP
jgi:hypothetical protein